jgi:hypothetical protein
MMTEQAQPVGGQIAVVTDHEYSVWDDDDGDHRITQTRFYEGDGVMIAISELNFPNQWDDARFDELCRRLEAGWNTTP